MSKQLINIFFLLLIAITSLPLKQAGGLFFKKEVREEMCDDCCEGLVKKGSDNLAVKDLPHYFYHLQIIATPLSQPLPDHISHVGWRLPLWPAVEIHTPPPNQAAFPHAV